MTNEELKTSRDLSLAVVLLSTLYFLIILAPLDYSPHFWGINHLSYVSWGARALVLLAAVAVPALVLRAVENMRFKRFLRRVLVYLIVPLLVLGIFYLLRVKSHYLGDGILRSREIEHGFWYLPTEPLSVLVNYLLYRVTTKLFDFTALQGMEFVSFLSGLLYYYAAVYLARVIGRQGIERVFVFFLLFFSGTSLLFCGYVETYSLLPTGFCLFMAVGIQAVQKKRLVIATSLLYLVLVLLHFSSFLLAPCMLVLAYRYYKHKDRKSSLGSLIVIPISIAIAFILSRYSVHATPGIGHFLIPLLPGDEPYWLFSWTHLLDVANELLLTAAPALILLLALLLSRRRPDLARYPRATFALAAVPGALLFLGLLDPKLGYASDWDLFSSGGVVLTITALLLFTATGPNRVQLSGRIALAATGVLAFLSYAFLNSGYDRSIDRQVDILSIYGERGGIGFESMGNHLNMIGEKEMAERMWRRALRTKPHRRTYSNLGQLMVTQGRLKEAEYYLTEGLKLDSNYAPMHMILGKTYTEMHRPEEAEYHLQKAVTMDPEEPTFRHNYAYFLISQERYEEAEEQARAAVRIAPDNATFVCGLGVCLGALGENEEARELFLLAARLQPGHPQAHYGLARLAVSEGNLQEARRICENQIRDYPHSSMRKRFEEILRLLPPPAPAEPQAPGQQSE